MTTLDLTIAPPRPIDVILPEPVKIGRYDGVIKDMMAAFTAGDHATACQFMLDILRQIEGDQRGPSPESVADTGQALHAVLTLFCRPDFVVPETTSKAFLWFNPTIANAIGMAAECTTDAYVASLEGQRQQVFKSCVLLSPRNHLDLRYDDLCQAAPGLASSWFCQTYKTAFSGNINHRCRSKLLEISKAAWNRFTHVKDIQEPYFLCTYLGDMDAERNVKSIINRAVSRVAPKIDNGKPSKTIAVVSDLWMEGHSVHRTLKAYIEAIKPDYKLVLVSTMREKEDLDTSLFDRTIKLSYDGENLETKPLERLGLDAVIYPDVGMTGSSIMLSNMRIAPVQIMMTGHPVSTFGSEIDYFISGQLVENAEHQANYTETLVRLPGFGATHAKPTYEHKHTPKDFDGVVINASWYGQKITRPFLDLVNQAIGETGEKVRLQIFAGGAASTRGAFGVFIRDIGEAITNAEVVVYPHLGYDEYMGEMEKADFAIDCSPFAGSNTVSDNLWLRKPVIALEGDRWFNRIGPAMLRSVGLNGLIATTEEQYAGLIFDMVKYGHVRDAYAADLAAADLDACLYSPVGAEDFRSWLNSVLRASPALLA
jgi:hypothetical protein